MLVESEHLHQREIVLGLTGLRNAAHQADGDGKVVVSRGVRTDCVNGP